MEMLENSAVYLFVLFGGYVLKRLGVFDADDARTLSKIIMKITLPAAILKGFAGVDLTVYLVRIAVMTVVLNAALLGAGVLFSRRRSSGERGLCVLNSNTFNCGNFAMPFLSNVVSAESFAGVCMFDMANAVFTFGPNMALAQKVMGSADGKITVKNVLRRMFREPTWVVYCVLIVTMLLNISMPDFVLQVANLAGNANSFLGMLCIGILFEIHLPKNDVGLIAGILARRYFICGLFACYAYFFLPVPAEMARTTAIVLMAPIANCAAIISVENGCDGTAAAVVNSMSMVISIVCMVLMLVLLPMPIR